MSRRRNQPIQVGLEPRARLLPPEVGARQAGRRLRARANLAVVLVLAVVLIANGLAAVSVVTSQQALESAQDRSARLLAQQAEFGVLRKVKSDIETARAAQRVGASTEIQWRSYLASVEQLSASAGVTITAITASSASPLELFPQSTTPFAAPRVATLTLQATAADLAAAKAWLEALGALPGFVGAALTNATRNDAGYEFSCVVDVGPEAQSDRFADGSSTPESPDPVSPGAGTPGTEAARKEG